MATHNFKQDLLFERSTKGTHLYKAPPSGASTPNLYNQYVPKRLLPDPPPTRIWVEVSWEASGEAD